MFASRFHTADDVARGERFTQDIPGAQIESFGPETVIGEPRRNDQGRRIGLGLNVAQDVDPGSRGQLAFAQDDGDVVLLEKHLDARETVGLQDGPARQVERLERRMVLGDRTDGKHFQRFAVGVRDAGGPLSNGTRHCLPRLGRAAGTVVGRAGWSDGPKRARIRVPIAATRTPPTQTNSIGMRFSFFWLPIWLPVQLVHQSFRANLGHTAEDLKQREFSGR